MLCDRRKRQRNRFAFLRRNPHRKRHRKTSKFRQVFVPRHRPHPRRDSKRVRHTAVDRHQTQTDDVTDDKIYFVRVLRALKAWFLRSRSSSTPTVTFPLLHTAVHGYLQAESNQYTVLPRGSSVRVGKRPASCGRSCVVGPRHPNAAPRTFLAETESRTLNTQLVEYTKYHRREVSRGRALYRSQHGSRELLA